MPRYLAIAGTHGSRRRLDWDHPRSAFADFLRARGLEPLEEDERRRYAWSTVLDGIDGRDDTWDAAGRALYHYLVPPLGIGGPAIPPRETFIVAHSHAGQVVAFACGVYGLEVEGLVTVGTPVRGGRMTEVYAAAAPRIRRHLHLHSRRDWWQVVGSLFDGRWGIHREHPHADNQEMPKGHGDVLRDPGLFALWVSRGWISYLQPEVAGVG
ncbi:MAG TPA: hypothetical protein VM364_08115 [Vicinamibacterales bacterium]|nr:hypothetical protein [Vicinamibacterales bacterium]